uniref:Uncharacterized protein n=1 Tax=Mycena chlorophos TaxID=658473 RepID=A0ABQ0L0I6_MYCCL|nr:predicted protein [Mycena chlorophos]
MQAFQITRVHLTRKFDAWNVMRARGSTDKQTIASLRKEIVVITNTGAQEASGDPEAKVRYTNYYVGTVLRHGIKLVGIPGGGEPRSPSTVSTMDELRAILGALVSETMRWEKITPQERLALEEEFKDQIAAGSRTRRVRSDVGGKHKSRKDKNDQKSVKAASEDEDEESFEDEDEDEDGIEQDEEGEGGIEQDEEDEDEDEDLPSLILANGDKDEDDNELGTTNNDEITNTALVSSNESSNTPPIPHSTALNNGPTPLSDSTNLSANGIPSSMMGVFSTMPESGGAGNKRKGSENEDFEQPPAKKAKQAKKAAKDKSAAAPAPRRTLRDHKTGRMAQAIAALRCVEEEIDREP